MTRLGILGGTFDPIHYGHLDAADAARHAFSLDGVLFVPAHDPPHKPTEPGASGADRLAMASLAIEGRVGDRVSDIELRREGPSYTVTTLRDLHAQGWTPTQLYFIIGTDAFAEIATWYAYPAVLECAHFIVVTRPGSADVSPTQHGQERPEHAQHGTGIYHVSAPTRDVSSTVIRARLATGQPIDDLVPAPVERYIRTHHLYGAADDRNG